MKQIFLDILVGLMVITVLFAVIFCICLHPLYAGGFCMIISFVILCGVLGSILRNLP